MQTYIQHFSAAGLDNVIFGTGNEPDNSPDPAWNGNWVENTKRYIAGMRRLGYTGPILCDTPGQDSQTWGNDQYAAIQASDPNKNIGFQEHEYGWNQGNIIPVCTAVINGQPAYKQFPIFITEAGWDVNGGNLDDWAYKCINENLGGAIFFWWNAPAQGYGPPTVNADGINLSSYGVTWRDHFWKASGMPDGWYNAGSTPGNNIPSKIEAENYTSMFGIATENCSEGTLNAGWTDNGDWMNYSVNVGTGGTFSVDCRVASGSSGGSFQIKSGSTVLATVNIPATGGWQSWQTVNSGSFNLPAGNQTIQVYANTGGWNLNWMDFKK